METLPGDSCESQSQLKKITIPSKVNVTKRNVIPITVTGDNTFKFGMRESSTIGARNRVMTTRTEMGKNVLRTATTFPPMKVKKTVQIASCNVHTNILINRPHRNPYVISPKSY